MRGGVPFIPTGAMFKNTHLQQPTSSGDEFPTYRRTKQIYGREKTSAKVDGPLVF